MAALSITSAQRVQRTVSRQRHVTNVPPRSSSIWMRTISSNELSALKPSSRARRASMRCGQPSTMRATSGSSARRMRAATRSPAMRRSDAICSATVQHTPGIERLMRGPSVSRAKPAAWTRKPTAARGLACVCTTVSETGSRLVGLARPHHDARQTDTDAVAEAAPGIVGEQRFPDRLLRAVGGQRREMKIVGDRGRKWRAEHRDGGGVDQARPIAVADRTNRFEQRAGAVEVDAIALVEIEFGFAGDDAGEMKDHLGATRDRLGGFFGRRQIGGDGLGLSFEVFLLGGGNNVKQGQLVDRLAAKRALLAEPLGQLSADHPGGASDENLHVLRAPAHYSRVPDKRAPKARLRASSMRYGASKAPGPKATGRYRFLSLLGPGRRSASLHPPGTRGRFNSLKLVRCRPSASKFSGASQRSKAALRAGHSLSSIENQALSRLRPFAIRCCRKVPS